jgi:hypothetical protein
VLVVVGFALVVWQLSTIGTRLSQLLALLKVIDGEVFHLAQEQDPNYGACDSCGRRTVVRHVVPKNRTGDADTSDMFYCQSCWWTSDSVQISDDNKHYKDRLSERDRMAANIGPG